MNHVLNSLRHPNESREYRDARDALLKDEQELVDKVKSVAERRRNLPPGGQLKEDYVFQWANDGKVGKRVKFSELFADKNTLLLYSFMYGPNWDNPCPSCTSLVDGFDRTWYQVTQHAAFVAIAKAPADRINAWAKQRGWSQIALVSGSDSPYQADYKCQGDSDDMQWPVMHVFRRQDGKIFHFWGTELSANHVDTVWPYWNLMDYPKTKKKYKKKETRGTNHGEGSPTHHRGSQSYGEPPPLNRKRSGIVSVVPRESSVAEEPAIGPGEENVGGPSILDQ